MRKLSACTVFLLASLLLWNVVGYAVGDGVFHDRFSEVPRFLVIATWGDGGTVDPPEQRVAAGSTATFQLIPEQGFGPDTVDATCSGSLDGHTFTTGAVTKDCTVNVTFAVVNYTLTLVADPASGGNVSGSGEYVFGALVTATAAANAGYQFGFWTEEGILVSEDAKYEFTMPAGNLTLVANFNLNTYTVIFLDWDGSELSSQQVEHGSDATAPPDPSRVGYTFTGWDVDFTNVTTDLVVTALYQINTYTVIFLDWDGSELSSHQVEHGSDATAPPDPSRVGYAFIGWDVDFTNVTSDLVVMALYQMHALINDTGIDWCADDSNNGLMCPLGSHPSQDGDHGRDALARQGLLTKIGTGAAGFDFTKLDYGGNDLPTTAISWPCVRDNHTALIWEVKSADEEDPRAAIHTYTWFNDDYSSNGGVAGTQNGGVCIGSSCDTQSYIAYLNQIELCSRSDWRLPSVRELGDIVNRNAFGPAIDENFFPNTQSSTTCCSVAYWTSVPDSGSLTVATPSAWLVNFYEGAESRDFKSSRRHVRAVAGNPNTLPFDSITSGREIDDLICYSSSYQAQTPSDEFLLVADGGSVLHLATGLEWQRCSIGQAWDGETCDGFAAQLDWSEALQVAESAGDGWRLPNISELRSITERCVRGTGVNPNVFPNTLVAPDVAPAYWSSSPSAARPHQAWRQSKGAFQAAHFLNKDQAVLSVRLVRNYRISDDSERGQRSALPE